jgi:tRNA pseudouridine38-40 synthase
LADPPQLTVAGRTDAGVHARGQVAHVDVAPDNLPIVQLGATIPGQSRSLLHDHPDGGFGAGRDAGFGAGRLARSLNGVLPVDVRVRSVLLAPDGFDARFSALSRRYSYRVADGWLDPLRRHDTLGYPRALDVDAMNLASSALLGEHDFAAFCRRREGASTVRGLLRFGWAREADGVVVATVEADAFCHSMVRALVGCLLSVGDGRQAPDWPAAVLKAGVRDSAVTVVPPHGLTLEEVRYPDDESLAARAAQTRARRDLPADE